MAPVQIRVKCMIFLGNWLCKAFMPPCHYAPARRRRFSSKQQNARKNSLNLTPKRDVHAEPIHGQESCRHKEEKEVSRWLWINNGQSQSLSASDGIQREALVFPRDVLPTAGQNPLELGYLAPIPSQEDRGRGSKHERL